MLHILKNNGEIVSYQLKRVARSVQLSCQAAEIESSEATAAVKSAVTALHQWLRDKEEVTTSDIRFQVTKALKETQPQAAVIYENARSLE